MGIIVPNKKTRKNWNKIDIYWTCWAGYFKKVQRWFNKTMF